MGLSGGSRPSWTAVGPGVSGPGITTAPYPIQPGPPILPRSFHRPRASTEGSLTENINKTGVRFWTDCAGRIAGTLSFLDARLAANVGNS